MIAQFALSRENNTNVFYKEYCNDYCYPHFHSHLEIYFVTDGEMEIEVNGVSKTLKANEIRLHHQEKSSSSIRDQL